MRLLNTVTGLFECFAEPRTVRYAILSHVWAAADDFQTAPEQTYQEIRRIQTNAASRPSKGTTMSLFCQYSEKIRKVCQLAREHGFRYVWIDSCCIDKASGSENTEAMNSMFEWYRCATVCFAYLDDVDDGEDVEVEVEDSGFRRSRWFTRGWTLQELIAPETVLFFSKGWALLGTKHRLARVIEEHTGIESAVLRHERSHADVCVARRMAWAAQRQTTLVEDEAYCLMGLFGVRLPVRYGEGRHAFVRLQKAILEQQTPDQTIFAWGGLPGACVVADALRSDSSFKAIVPGPHASAMTGTIPDTAVLRHCPGFHLFAPSPSGFEAHLSSELETVPYRSFYDDLFGSGYFDSISPHIHCHWAIPHGVRIQLPAVPICDDVFRVSYYIALLACRNARTGHLVALLLRDVAPDSSSNGDTASDGIHMAVCDTTVVRNTPSPSSRLIQISLVGLAALKHLVRMRDVYLPI